MSANMLRHKYMRDFVGKSKYPRNLAWIVVSGYLLQIAVAVGAGSYLLNYLAAPYVILIVPILMIFVGTRMRGLNNIVHECTHSTFSEVRADNVMIGGLCASLLFNSFNDYRDEHLSHHTHLGDYEHDLDLRRIEKMRLHDQLSKRVILRHLMNPLLGRHLPHYLSLNMSGRDGRFLRFFKFAWLFTVSLLTLVFPLTLLIFLIIPFVLIYSALNYWSDCFDHAGIVSADDDLDASRNILAPRYARWLFFPRNDCFHLVHHLFPHVPARHLAATHDALSDDPLYRSRRNAVRSPKESRGNPIPAE